MSTKTTTYTRNATSAILTADTDTDAVLVEDGAEDRVRPSTGEPGEVFAGFATMAGRAGQDVGLKKDGSLAAPRASGAVAFMDWVKPAAGGRVQTAAAGDPGACGRAQSAAEDGERVTIQAALPAQAGGGEPPETTTQVPAAPAGTITTYPLTVPTGATSIEIIAREGAQ